MNDQQQLEAAIAFLESRRDVLGDKIVDAATAPLHRELTVRTLSVSERRKQITVLFADISNFTAMSETMDAEDVRNIVDSLWKRIDKVIIDHGGSIDKHIGDAVMALWGIEQTREDDPERAVRAALAMQKAMRNWRQDTQETLPEISALDPPISVRIGINTGNVILGIVGTTGEFTAIGDTVNTANRLEQAAPLGNILISHSTYLHVRGLFELRERDPIKVKGKSKELSTYLVQSAKPQKFRLEQRGVEGVVTPMIGRAKDFAQLQECFYEVLLQNCPQFVLITGDAGIGKSRLIYEFNSWMESQSWRTSYFKGRARLETSHISYGLLRDVILQRYGIGDGDTPETVQNKLELGFFNEWEPESDIQKKTHFIAQLIGCSLASSRFVSAELLQNDEWRQMAIEYVIDYFKAVSHTEPTVFLIEDIHWADKESIEILKRSVDEATDQILMVLCTARPYVIDHLIDTDQVDARYTVHFLSPLGHKECGELIEAILCKADSIPTTLYDMVISRAQGNPYHIEELIKMLVNDKVIIKNEAQWIIHPDRLADARVPTTLTSILEARLDGLPTPMDRVFQCAAIIGSVFWQEAVDYVLNGMGAACEHEIDDAISHLQQMSLVRKCEVSSIPGASEYTITNSLLQQVCYERTLKRNRRLYHELFADWLVNLALDDFTICEMAIHHLLLAGCQDKAADYLQRTSRSLMADTNNEMAATYLSKALSIIPEDNQQWRHDLLQLHREAHRNLAQRADQKDNGEVLEGECAEPDPSLHDENQLR